MSTWIFKPGLAALAASVALAGCAGAPNLSGGGLATGRTAPKTLAVASRAVIVAGPPGYCVDRAVSKVSAGSAFVVMASCASITGNSGADAPRSPALLTASVTKAEVGGTLPDAAALKTFFSSDAGRAALARDAQAGSVEVLGTRSIDDAFMIRLSDKSQGGIEGVDETYWRGLAVLNGQFLTISVVSFSDFPLTSDQGLATLRAFLAQIRVQSSPKAAAS